MNRAVCCIVVAATLVTAACSGDDDAGGATLPPTTESEPTTTASTTTASTTTSTTVAPTTTVDLEPLKAQIAADWQRARDLRTQITENPTLENLDAALAQIAVPDSKNYNDLKAFVTGMVERGERVIRGTPDLYRYEIERVDLVGSPPYTETVVTFCWVSNRVRIDAVGNVLPDTGPLVAARREERLQPTTNGWLGAGDLVDLWQGLDVAECAPA